MKLTEFELKVLNKLKHVPRGRVTTYGALARSVGRPGAARAVGNALNKNPDAPITPCHRVVYSDGRLGGYAGGAEKKIGLLKGEGVGVKNGRIVDFKKIFYRF
ncbi:cysteine methyltransferase [Candidatus Falkowbacteria bacterium RIFOXYB2_FULL_47_14]|uniref:methylated-DNA--[protein]-cysteine S-methyltransferase n=1 Tax=Candidatus Falkowbacteria bacterium RIFOXYA2_FULL_47_19 TaxID=1797994 RepID=A0A1F5SHQ9_9BACT|nr:MAG: cysteine methyltransferase [Candidatus Falkowbacteria bacterium RIFOXYA2_FULL_47_19]OGF36690.1 MAG: cysteine methyltransferase [Candidatus Falkowbacteria bacterium RIFOXYC2_FULL_46_15]OGF42486.1 MAG: cysteine methyltransferase [Candidatus Falkowbacteria bacterium RIFOXYB2_FULL_47_14]